MWASQALVSTWDLLAWEGSFQWDQEGLLSVPSPQETHHGPYTPQMWWLLHSKANLMSACKSDPE